MSNSIQSAFGSDEDNFRSSFSSSNSSSSMLTSAFTSDDSSNPFEFTTLQPSQSASQSASQSVSQSAFVPIVFAPATSTTQSSQSSFTTLFPSSLSSSSSSFLPESISIPSTGRHKLSISYREGTKRPKGLTNIIIPDNIPDRGSSVENRYQHTKRTMSEVEQEIKKQIYKYRSISCDIKHSPVVHVDEHKAWDDKIHKHLARIMKELNNLQKTLVEFKQYTHHR